MLRQQPCGAALTRRRAIALAALLAQAACGATARPADSSPADVADLDIDSPRHPLPTPPSRRSGPPPAQASPPTETASLTGRRARRFRGRRIDLDVVDARLADVLRLLAEVGNVNIVIADDVAGSVTLRVRSVPWDQLLDSIARSKRLDVHWDGGVIMVRRGAAAD